MLSGDIQNYLDSLGMFGWKLGLERMLVLADALGQPQKKYPVIHVAGSNGKGTVARLLESIYSRAGFRVGLYTSPHVLSPTERIRIDGQEISEESFVRDLREIQPLLEENGATYFEALTLLAMFCFAKNCVDLAILEVGLGGRFDATNIVEPVCSIITSISLEHTDYLGKTTAAIAFEKGGIIKAGAPCVNGNLDPEAYAVVAKRCEEQSVELVPGDEISIGLTAMIDLGMKLRMERQGKIYTFETPVVGKHQITNIKTALTVIREMQTKFPCSDDAIVHGLQTASMPGRFQIWHKSPTVILDVAHNPESVAALKNSLKQLFRGKKFIFLIGMLGDKDAKATLSHLKMIDPQCICLSPKTSRAMAVEQLHMMACDVGFVSQKAGNIREAFAAALALHDPQSVIVVTGSHYIVGEFLENQDVLRNMIAR